MKDWNAKWIMFEECPENTTPVFRKEFCLEEKPAEASLDICGLGFYLLEINGMRVGEELLQPAFTAYDKTVLYNTHDITDFLAAGNNEIRVTLGNGWFHEPGEDCFDFEHAVWKNHPQMICRLYADGRVILRSDSGWQCREGKWSYNSVRFGETYDAGAEEKEWRQAAVAKGPGGLLKKQKLPGIRIQEYREPVTVKDKVYDFGCNLSGDVEITLEGKQGETVEIVYGERLDARGGIDQTLIKRHGDIPRNQIDYYRKGKDGEETWHPEFSYKGFRYVQVKGDAAVVQIKARVFYTDLQTAGGFQCPDVCLQRIYDASLRSVRTNFHHIPTDCPHREKNGWTGDAHMSCEFALLNLDMEDAYLQYLDSLTDCQWPSGQLPCIAPTSVYGYNYQSGPTWDAALIFIPWQLYRFTGKTEILERYYEAMKKYLHYTRQISEEGICRSGLGDFLPDEAQEVCPAGMILSCFIMRMAQIMEQISGILGKEDGNEWQTLAAYIRKAVIRELRIMQDNGELFKLRALFRVIGTSGKRSKRAGRYRAGEGIPGRGRYLRIHLYIGNAHEIRIPGGCAPGGGTEGMSRLGLHASGWRKFPVGALERKTGIAEPPYAFRHRGLDVQGSDRVGSGGMRTRLEKDCIETACYGTGDRMPCMAPHALGNRKDCFGKRKTLCGIARRRIRLCTLERKTI